MKKSLVFFLWILVLGSCFLQAQSTTYYVVREASSYYVVPQDRKSTLYEQVIPPYKMSVIDKKTASYIALDDLLKSPISKKVLKSNSKYVKRVLEIQPPSEAGLFREENKEIIYEVRDIKEIYGRDKEGRYWKKIGDLPQKWYICEICHKTYSKLYKVGDKWVCSHCWIKAYMEKNRKEKNYLMKNYP